MGIFKVQVEMATHDAVMAGVFDQEVTWLRVVADSDADAVLLACQIAHTTNPVDMMPTGATLLDFPC